MKPWPPVFRSFLSRTVKRRRSSGAEAGLRLTLEISLGDFAVRNLASRPEWRKKMGQSGATPQKGSMIERELLKNLKRTFWPEKKLREGQSRNPEITIDTLEEIQPGMMIHRVEEDDLRQSRLQGAAFR